jgi:hypothetical protein
MPRHMLLNAPHSVAATQMPLPTKYCSFSEVRFTMSPHFAFFGQVSFSPAMSNIFMREAVIYRTVKSVVRVGTQAGKCGICIGKMGSGTEVSHNTSVFLVAVIPPILHTHSFLYLRRCKITLTTDNVVKQHT